MKAPMIALAAGLTLAVPACAPEAAEPPVASFEAPSEAKLAEVLAHERRKEDSARDAHRHPAETLTFFDVEPHHTVIEYAPGSGWYTRILAPYLAEKGRFIAVGFDPDTVDALDESFKARLREGAAGFSATQSKALGIAPEKLPFHFGNNVPESLNGQVDRVLIIRMMHNLLRWGIAEDEIAALRSTMKPGALLGVVQHRARLDAPDEYVDGNKGYLKQADLIAWFESQGFELVGTSEINANPDDPADHEAGVWTLPPTFALGDKDREKYEAIGESDRMTLLFRKTI